MSSEQSASLHLVTEEAAGAAGAKADLPDSGLICLVMLARFHALAADPDQLAHEFREPGKPFSRVEILLAAKKLGLVARSAKPDLARLATTPLPAIAMCRGGGFIILARVEADPADAQVLRLLVHDPAVERPEVMTRAQFEARCTGELILFTSRASLAGEMARFDFSWFVPAVIKYRKLLLEVLIVSFVLQCFALVTPLFFQVVTDKVLVHRGLSTLDVVAIGMVTVTVFEVMLTALRTYVFAHTTSRIDVELGARLFRHLLSLPLAYFQARRVGRAIALAHHNGLIPSMAIRMSSSQAARLRF